MKRFLLQITLFFTVLSGFSHNTDSLLNVIKKEGIDKSFAYNALYKITKKQDRDSAKVNFLDKAYFEALKHNNQKQLGRVLINLGLYYKFKAQIDTAAILYQEALKVSLKANDTLGISKVYNNLSTYYFDLSQYEKAVELLRKAIEYRSLLGNPKGLGISYNLLGNVYSKWGKNKEAIDNYMIALKKFEEANFMLGVSSCYNNIGIIYQSMSQNTDTILLNKALEQINQALVINKKNLFISALAECQTGAAGVYATKSEIARCIADTIQDELLQKKYVQTGEAYFKKALKYSQESKQNCLKIGNKRGLAVSYIGIGSILLERKSRGDIIEALKNSQKALVIAKEIGNENFSTICLVQIARAYQELGQNKKALEYLFQAKYLAEKLNLKSLLTGIYEPISDAYSYLGNYPMALKYHKKFHDKYEEITQNETKKTIADLEIKHETDKKDAALKLANKEKEKEQEKSKRQRFVIYGFIGVFVIIIFFSLIVLRQFKQIRRSNNALSEQKKQIEKANQELNHQNEEIAAQKNHIEKIHQEVSDSIRYAERIQKAILPKTDDITGKISDRFILFKPKDIVSGDFYWQKILKKNNLYIATAADCTGHGVPGAFMSMLGVAFLNETVAKSSIHNTGQALDSLRQSVINSLHQTGKEGEAQDGMDIALIALNYENQTLQFSGANNPLYVVRTKDKPTIEIAEKIVEGETHNLYEIKGDKMPIGIYKKDLTNFTTHSLQLDKGDAIYMFSDGYADQFGGPKGKKLKYLPFKRLLLENVNKSMAEQRQILDNYFENWRGDLEQIDDVIVFGIKV